MVAGPAICGRGSQQQLINQVLTAVIKDYALDTKLATSATTTWTPSLVTNILKSIPRLLFQSPRSIGRQHTHRHRPPLKQRYLNNTPPLGPAAYRDPQRVALGLQKAMEFYYWVETHFHFQHDEITCREMAIVLAKANDLKGLWGFLKKMARREGQNLVTTQSVTCLIKVLGEEGLVNEALVAFYRMKQFRCKPDVYAYNTIIYALCRVGNFNKARFLLEQMELPGFICPPDTCTYTTLISSYCKYSMQTGSRKAIRRRLWEANHLFRIMLFKGFVPDVVTYNCLIDGCCKTYRIGRALELFQGMSKSRSVPNRVTYNSFIRYFCAVNEIDKAIEMMRRMQEMKHGVPTSSSFTPIIHALCEVGRVVEARDFLVELVDGGSIPREYTYKLVCDVLNASEQSRLLNDELHKRIKDGMENRYKQVMKIKPIMRKVIL
ncbi:PPR domain-containing protein/PPR_2 domain-containing protein [Cephalotus follicularis]|uniref:PPR domain-containing protein/PPR_2 domain-containing protein n=1 Tax=Cephalotus follicularis TaxID=3775 RepID=A0A1Q3CLN3_CEPFO|nr:PPR domain-containing protein/PPR_2 domain-containing protein [Cephalotus follicularis]